MSDENVGVFDSLVQGETMASDHGFHWRFFFADHMELQWSEESQGVHTSQINKNIGVSNSYVLV